MHDANKHCPASNTKSCTTLRLKKFISRALFISINLKTQMTSLPQGQFVGKIFNEAVNYGQRFGHSDMQSTFKTPYQWVLNSDGKIKGRRNSSSANV